MTATPRARQFASEIYMVAEIEAITDPDAAGDAFALAAAVLEAADEIDRLADEAR